MPDKAEKKRTRHDGATEQGAKLFYPWIQKQHFITYGNRPSDSKREEHLIVPHGPHLRRIGSPFGHWKVTKLWLLAVLMRIHEMRKNARTQVGACQMKNRHRGLGNRRKK